MKMNIDFRLLSLFTAAFLLLGAVATTGLAQAQDPPDKPADGKPAQTGKPNDDRKPDRDQDPERGDADKAQGAGRDANDAVKDSGAKPSSEEAKVMRRAMLEEANYRKRLAVINRLREIATEKGNEERLAKLDLLEEKLNAHHERNLARAEREIGRGKAGALKDKLAKGRGKSKGRDGDQGRASKDGDDQGQAGDDGKPDRDAKGGKSEGAGKGKGEDAGKDKGNGKGGKPDAAGEDEGKGKGGKPDAAGKGEGKGKGGKPGGAP